MEKKITKRECLNSFKEMIDFCESQGQDFTVPYDALRNYADNELKLLDNKALAAQKRAEQRKIDGDELRDNIYSVLDVDYMILDDIRAAIGNGVTAQEITSRLTQLVELGKVIKDKVSVKLDNGKTKRLTGYKKAD